MRCHGNNNARWREQWDHVDSDRFFSVNKVYAPLIVIKFVDVVLSSYDYFQASQISTDPAGRNVIDRSIFYITTVIII